MLVALKNPNVRHALTTFCSNISFRFCDDVNNTWPCSYDGSGQGACSGDWTAGLIADKVKIPESLKPGSYVLGWRYDCEETARKDNNVPIATRTFRIVIAEPIPSLCHVCNILTPVPSFLQRYGRTVPM